MPNFTSIFTKLLSLALLCCFLLFGHITNAAVPKQIGTFDPSRIEERLNENTLPKTIDDDHLKYEFPEEDKAEDKFLLKKVNIQGLKSVKREDIDHIIAPFIGQKVGFNAIKQIAEEIKLFYLVKGFFLVKTIVPEQTVTRGEIKIVVIEGFISQVRVREGKATTALKGDHLGIINAMINKIKHMHTVNGDELQRSLLLLNDLGAIDATATMKTAAQAGAVDLELEIKDTKTPRFHSFISADNFGSKYSGPAEFSVGSNIRGILFSYDELSLRGLNTLQIKEASFLSGNYKTPINSYGTVFSINSNYIKTKPGANLKANNIIGSMHGFSSGFSHPLMRRKIMNLHGSIKFEAKNINTDVLGIKLYQDKIRALRLALQFDNIDSYYGANILNLTYSQGLNMFGARKSGSPLLSRTDGRSDFKKVEANVARLQQISSSFNLLVNFKGQYAFTPLLSSEEFGYGGQEFGRAYDPSELLGDHGFAGGAELRYLKLPKVFGFTSQPFAFYDYGKIMQKRRIDGSSLIASSAGFGIKLWYGTHVTGSLYYAAPLKKNLISNGEITKKSNKVLFNITCNF